jgi:intein-encoded DNA endonuclease-like protein
MNRFKVGDKVVVTGYVNKRSEYYYFAPEMDSCIGLVTRVRRIGKDGSVKLDIDGGYYSWHPSWLRMATDSEKLKWQKIDEMRRRLGYE